MMTTKSMKICFFLYENEMKRMKFLMNDNEKLYYNTYIHTHTTHTKSKIYV